MCNTRPDITHKIDTLIGDFIFATIVVTIALVLWNSGSSPHVWIYHNVLGLFLAFGLAFCVYSVRQLAVISSVLHSK